MTEQQMRDVVRKEMEAVGGLRKAARKWGVSSAYLHDCLNGRRLPGPSILKPLGYERKRTTVYLKSKIEVDTAKDKS